MKCCQDKHFYHKVHKKDSPFDVQLALTYRCNLRCLHCYCQGISAHKEELKTREVVRILDELHRAGCFWLVLTGGEPFLREDFLDIYSYAKKKGFLVTIFTNAVLLNQDILRVLRQAPPYCLEVTFNGMTAATYEKISRVPGSFLRASENIRILAEQGLPLIIKTNLMRLNKKEFPLIKRWALDLLKRRGLTYPFKYDFMLHPRLNGDSAPLRYRLTFKQLQDVLGRDEDVWQQYQEELHRPFPQFDCDSDLLYHCNTWREQVCVDPFGRLKFCLFSDKYSADLEKVPFDGTFRQMIGKVEKEKFKTNSRCRRCKLRSICHWCPARAALETGSEERPVAYYCRMTKNIAAQTRRLRRRPVS